jgi:hypothetical protein
MDIYRGCIAHHNSLSIEAMESLSCAPNHYYFCDFNRLVGSSDLQRVSNLQQSSLDATISSSATVGTIQAQVYKDIHSILLNGLGCQKSHVERIRID